MKLMQRMQVNTSQRSRNAKDSTLNLELHKLSCVNSDETMDTVLRSIRKTRKADLRGADKSKLQSILLLSSPSQLNPYQLLKELHGLKQDRGQAVFDFLAQMETVWDQLTSCEPVLKDSTDAKAYDDYEPVRTSLLHQNPLPSLEDALPRLKSEETRLGLTRSKSDHVFATREKYVATITVLGTPLPNVLLLNATNANRRDISALTIPDNSFIIASSQDT
ncbi:hypothetical protein PIB30_047884 [Stylosanthes scabra]|uniref:Uncharacterized protein n=1 Tax=Stylosanthes scabra TaxID=79078 RepID=A0ABU6YFH3_9FABA|nr:hypothetical protein [Stylosanthes scabra]